MSWLKEVEELRRRQAFAEGMGGPEGIARQHRGGKLTARERIDILADPDSFREFMSLRGAGAYENGELAGFTPKAFVCGTVELAGRKAFVSAGDFTVRGGSGGAHGGLGEELSVTDRALEWLLPLIRLLDASGGSVRAFEEQGRTYLPDGNTWTQYGQYTITIVSGAPHLAAAEAFVEFLLSSTGQAEMKADQFEIVSPPTVTGTGVPSGLTNLLG